ncbi:MAG: UdgX family uracil-DNA binding protein [Hyphomonadaceae bacterium]
MIAAGLASDAGFEQWRDRARHFLSTGVRPEQIVWVGESGDLLAAPLPATLDPHPVTAPKAFIAIAEHAALHIDRQRFGVLYRVLWRLQANKRLMEDAADADVARLNALAKAVRRDMHKMHAFVRFKEISEHDGARFIAWFEPQHHIVRASADFFVRRFTGMRWSIVTPEASAHWDGEALRFGPGGARTDVPADDARDADWVAYYQNMFNPARLKVAAMTREMPKHYWRNLPEAAGIGAMIRSAPARAEEMVAAMPSLPRKRPGAAVERIKPEALPEGLDRIALHTQTPDSIIALQRALSACRACPLWKDATQAVPGEGLTDAPLLALVGEQPGDHEDLAGKPFVGPAGQVLNRALEAAGIVRGEVFVTNAVKHFKHEPRGKRRLHKRPVAGEMEICRWWVKHELELVKPRLVVALGVTALQSLSAHKGSLSAVRGRTLKTREGQEMRATIHPSALLRLPPHADKDAEFGLFVADLKAARAIAEALRTSSGADR